jgi:DNA-directed RNA polymerase subunit omega
MARVTVEDCLQTIENRFTMTNIAAKRARQLDNGSPALVEENGDKATVIALREIAEGLIDEYKLEQIAIEEELAKTAINTENNL